MFIHVAEAAFVNVAIRSLTCTRLNMPHSASKTPDAVWAAAIRRVLVYANPIAGSGKAREVAGKLGSALHAAGFIPDIVLNLLELPEHVMQADAAIAIGGDGTLRAVAKAFLDKDRAVPPLLPIPMGTANLMGQHLGLHWKTKDVPARAIAAIKHHHVVYLDAATANGQLFLLMAGVGIDASIVHELARIRRGPISMASYLLPAALALVQYEFVPLEVAVDGAQVFSGRPAMAFVGNVAEYGTGFPMLPQAKADDGLLDVCVVPALSIPHMVKQFLRAAAGEHLQAEGVVYLRGRQIAIRAPQPVPLQLDGDAAGHTPVDIQLLPLRVPFIVPAE